MCNKSLFAAGNMHGMHILWMCSWGQSCVHCIAGLMAKERNVLMLVEVEIC